MTFGAGSKVLASWASIRVKPNFRTLVILPSTWLVIRQGKAMLSPGDCDVQ